MSENVTINEDGQQHLFDSANRPIVFPDSIVPLVAVSAIQLRLNDVDDKPYHPNFGNGMRKFIVFM